MMMMILHIFDAFDLIWSIFKSDGATLVQFTPTAPIPVCGKMIYKLC